MKLQKKSSNGYTVLLGKVRKILIEGQQRIEAERLRTYWEAGRVIHADILHHKDRAEYGARVLNDLADDLDVNVRLLQRCVQFAKVYPKMPIATARSQFTWTHYRELSQISDDKKRSLFEKAAQRNHWSTNELIARIQSENGARGIPGFPAVKPRLTGEALHKPLAPLRGTLYTYCIVERPAVNADYTPELEVDLGFGVFYKVDDSRILSGLSEGDIVESRPREDAYKFYKGGRTAKDLYTYAAYIEKVIDGDTLKVRFDLGFNTEIRQTLRLRGIDCPEVDTKEGQAAKAFVQSYLKEAQTVIARSSRPDKYDRYLADVFVPSLQQKNRKVMERPASDEIRDASNDVYLNNLLLEHGHAVRME